MVNKKLATLGILIAVVLSMCIGQNIRALSDPTYPIKGPEGLEAREIESLKEAFKSQNGHEWDVDFYQWGVIHLAIRPYPEKDRSNVINEQELTAIALNFLSENRGFFGIVNPEELKVWIVDKRPLPGSEVYEWSIEFEQQRYETVPVYGSYLVMIVNQYGEIFSVKNRWYPIMGVPSIPKVSYDEAVRFAKAHLQTSPDPENVQLNIFPRFDNEANCLFFHLAWVIRFGNPVFKEISVDAIEPNIILTEKSIIVTKPLESIQSVFPQPIVSCVLALIIIVFFVILWKKLI